MLTPLACRGRCKDIYCITRQISVKLVLVPWHQLPINLRTFTPLAPTKGKPGLYHCTVQIVVHFLTLLNKNIRTKIDGVSLQQQQLSATESGPVNQNQKSEQVAEWIRCAEVKSGFSVFPDNEIGRKRRTAFWPQSPSTREDRASPA